MPGMKLGDFELSIFSDGTYPLDGGAFFGVIPKIMWSRKAAADEKNYVQAGLNSLLIRTGKKNVLVETGVGNKLSERMVKFYGQPAKLVANLAAGGVAPEDIDIVINTHLHFDHCGWNTRMVNGEAVPVFPNAQYIVQRGELEHAKDPSDRDRASYFPENFAPMEKTGQWSLLDGDAEVIPGVELIRAPGHNRDMMCVRLSGGGKAVFFTADLIPTTAHLPYPWIMGYDLYPLTTLENKKKWIPQAAREGWLVIFGHEPATPAGYLREQGGKFVLEPVVLNS